MFVVVWSFGLEVQIFDVCFIIYYWEVMFGQGQDLVEKMLEWVVNKFIFWQDFDSQWEKVDIFGQGFYFFFGVFILFSEGEI